MVLSVAAPIHQHRGKGRFRRRVIMGGGLNITEAKDLEGITGSSVPKERFQRGEDAADLLTKC